MTGSVLFYVQHLLGIGHLRRALRIVDALAGEGIAVTLVSGGEPLPELDETRADRIVQLAPIQARDAGFRDLVDAAGRPIDDELKESRRTMLLAAFAAARPDAVVIEAFPFGRRAFRFELDPLIDAARRSRPLPLVLCSLRDIVVAPEDPQRRRAIVERVRADFDVVLVHGDPAVIPLEASFPEAAEIADRLAYTGYVGSSSQPGESDRLGCGEVLVSAGGGAVGGRLLATAVEARRRGCLAGAVWRLLAGPNLPEAEFAALEARLPDGCNPRTLSAGISRHAAALSRFGEPGRVQHSPRHPRCPRRRGGRAVRRRTRDRADPAGGMAGRARRRRAGGGGRSCRPKASPARSNAQSCAAPRRWPSTPQAPPAPRELSNK